MTWQNEDAGPEDEEETGTDVVPMAQDPRIRCPKRTRTSITPNKYLHENRILMENIVNPCPVYERHVPQRVFY